MNLREAAQQALEAFKGLLTFNPTHEEYAKGRDAVAALRAALAEATIKDNLTVEPVAYVTGFSKNYATVQPVDPCLLMFVGMALYRSIRGGMRKPLTDEEIQECVGKVDDARLSGPITEFARAIERAHGIRGEK